jgi:adenylate cyclase
MDAQLSGIAAWLTERGLAGDSEATLLDGLCDRLLAAGVPLTRVLMGIDTLHPVHEGHIFQWNRDETTIAPKEYGRVDHEGEAGERWKRSPFYHLLETGGSVVRGRLTGECEREFAIFADLRAAGMTDYLAQLTRFGAESVIGNMDCIFSSWATDRAQGFDDQHIDALNDLMPFLAMAVKSATLARIAETLVQTYLGRDPGRRVLQGRIMRGVADRIDAVLWFSDLRGFTRITDTTPEAVIPLLNDYADVVVSAIHEHGGDVLKLIGDGVLAMFNGRDRVHAGRAALASAAAAQRAVDALSSERKAAGLPTTEMYLGLHVGEVFYGNVGSQSRLDFTVIGPAVNEVSRIAAMCRSVEQPLLLSEAFVAALPLSNRFVSVGRYALRGVSRAQELFTIDPERLAS